MSVVILPYCWCLIDLCRVFTQGTLHVLKKINKKDSFNKVFLLYDGKNVCNVLSFREYNWLFNYILSLSCRFLLVSNPYC